MEWVIVLAVIWLAVSWFGGPSARTRRVADRVAGGAAGGARRATYRHFRLRDFVWRVAIVIGVLLLIALFSGGDEEPASATETAEAAPSTETISSPLIFGDSGPDVTNLQARLAEEGLPVTVDGVYGQETADAVMAFQEREQLTVDGVVGSETAEALGISSG
jgi:Putative peptidoglycan binding domain